VVILDAMFCCTIRARVSTAARANVSANRAAWRALDALAVTARTLL
jgi:hypothetical protein